MTEAAVFAQHDAQSEPIGLQDEQGVSGGSSAAARAASSSTSGMGSDGTRGARSKDMRRSSKKKGRANSGVA